MTPTTPCTSPQALWSDQMPVKINEFWPPRCNCWDYTDASPRRWCTGTQFVDCFCFSLHIFPQKKCTVCFFSCLILFPDISRTCQTSKSRLASQNYKTKVPGCLENQGEPDHCEKCGHECSAAVWDNKLQLWRSRCLKVTVHPVTGGERKSAHECFKYLDWIWFWELKKNLFHTTKT